MFNNLNNSQLNDFKNELISTTYVIKFNKKLLQIQIQINMKNKILKIGYDNYIY